MESTKSNIFKIIIGALLFVAVVMLAVGYSVLRANLQERKAAQALEEDMPTDVNQAVPSSAVGTSEEVDEMYAPPTEEEIVLLEEAEAEEVAPPTEEEIVLLEEAEAEEALPPSHEEYVLLVKATLEGVASPTEAEIVSTLRMYGALSQLSDSELKAIVEAVQR